MLLILLLLFSYTLFKNNLSSYSNKFYEKCLSSTDVPHLRNLTKDYKYGKDLWNSLYKKSKKDEKYICLFLKKMRLFKYKDKIYYHRLYSNQLYMNKESTNGFFPDLSYLRLKPRNKNDFKNVISHTYDLQNYLYKYQHPSTCQNKKYIIIKGYSSGHGSEIHVFTSYLALAISNNRIAILDPYYKNEKAKGEFCEDYKNWLCFIEQLTNCSLQEDEFYKAKPFYNSSQKDKHLYISGTQKYKNLIPKKIIKFVSNSPIDKQKILHFWRIQASTFIFRLNQKTSIKTQKILSKSLGSKINDGCVNIWIRHGDKYKEMALIKADDYISSYKIYNIINGYNTPIYLSTDDPNVTLFFRNMKYTKVIYLNFARKNEDLKGNINRGAEMTLNFIADIKAALYCNAFSGTRKSNVVRLIDELRSTIGLSANALYFENGEIKFSNTSYEKDEFW